MTNSFTRNDDGSWTQDEPVVHGFRERIVWFLEAHNLHKLAALVELTR